MSAIAKGCAAGAALVAGVCVPFVSGGHSNAAFLCSPGQKGLPSVFPANADTASLLNKGYYPPSAELGKIKGGDNLGEYTLTCSPDPLLKPTGFYVDGNGIVTNIQVAPLGNYPQVK